MRATISSICLCAALLAPVVAAHGQSASGPAAALEAQAAAYPISLPGDRPPPPMSMMLRPPSGRPTGRNGPPPDTTPGPPLALALEAARAAVATCAADELRVGVAVMDSAGQIQVGLNADGAGPGHIFSAARKAVTAVAFGVPTSAVQDKLRAGDPAALALLKPNMVAMPGAVPLIVEGRVLGAIGASGGTGQQDEACAAAGAARIQDRLR